MLYFSKTCQNVCLKKTFITIWEYVQQKKVGWEEIFSELGFAGSRARKPWWESEGSALERFFHVVLRLNGALSV